ncbi:putative hydrolase of the HAD superfamily [Austwickia chelonae]|uniref:HAD family hydrolase n=1 Tax=Austwickia chelonae TaxID=100225 RepID=UPI00058D8683|nr:HAD family hydrolase [Austwickia chelonae]SEV86588.1 putative hydrolase of the HAD superfamily [Austwickia chelonae]
MTPRIVVFDIDGTLMDHAESARAGLQRWVTSLGHTMNHDIAQAWTAAERRHFTDWRDGRITFAEQRRRRLRDILPLLGEPVETDNDLDEAFEGYLQAYEAAWQPYPDVARSLASLQGKSFRLAVLSNGNDAQQRKKLSVIGVADAFPDVLTAESLGVAKPRPAAYERAAAALTIPPAQCLYVGDDYDLDVLAARAAGWQAIHLDRTGQHREEGAITSLNQLVHRLP